MPTVITIHGIRSRAAWQKQLSNIAPPPFRIISYDYGHFHLLYLTVAQYRRREVEKFANWFFEEMKKRRDKSRLPSIIAHSFGTYIIATALDKYPSIKIDKLILCGSVLPIEFDWQKLISRDQISCIRNEYSRDDIWVRFPWIVSRSMGKSGAVGFNWENCSLHENIEHPFHDHRGYLNPQHMRSNWLPYLNRAIPRLKTLDGRNADSIDHFRKLFSETFNLDRKAYGELDGFEENTLKIDEALKWAKLNADIFTFLIDTITNRPVGYINAAPISDELYSSIIKGEVISDNFDLDHLRLFERDKNTKVYLLSVVIDGRVSPLHREIGCPI